MKSTRLIIFIVLILIFIIGTTIVQNSSVIRVRAMKNQWKFVPDTISARAGQSVELRIYNEDAYPHGFFISELGINEILIPEKETIIHIKPKSSGTYGFYCSVVCGSGHYRMSGRLMVK